MLAAMYEDVACEQFVARERAALAVYLLEEAPLTTGALAERLGMTRAGAWALMNCIQRVVPVYFDDGLWRRLPRRGSR